MLIDEISICFYELFGVFDIELIEIALTVVVEEIGIGPLAIGETASSLIRLLCVDIRTWIRTKID